MKSWKKFLIVSLSLLFIITSVLAGLVNFVKVDNTNNKGQNQESGGVTPSSPDNYDGMIYYASESEETGASVAPRETKGGAIYVESGANLYMDGGVIDNHEGLYGGAVFVDNGGTFTMTGGTIEYNYSKFGGAVYVAEGGTFKIEKGDIVNNMAQYAPAIYVEAGGTVIISAEAHVGINEYIEVQDTMINYYVDGEHVYSRNQLLPAFNLGKAPLDYENCNGYFLDEEMTISVEQNDDLSTIETGASVQSIVKQTTNGILEYNLYTHTATPEKLTFTLNGETNTYSVKLKDTTVEGDIVIPMMYNDFNVGSLEKNAFYQAKNISVVYINGNIREISVNTFRESSIERVGITNKVKIIGSSAFYNCINLSSVNFINANDLATIDSYAFFGNTSLNEVSFPENLREIKNTAFHSSGISYVNFNSKLNIIGDYVFYNCKNITEINFPDGCELNSIGQAVFRECVNLINVDMINTMISTLPHHSFYDCINIEILKLPSSLENIVSNALTNCSGIQEIFFNENFSMIEFSAGVFNYCSNLSKINIENLRALTSIEEFLFVNCTKLTKIIIPDSLTTIKAKAFYNLSNLIEVDFENATSLEFIYDFAFSGCGLNTLDISNTIVFQLSSSVFANCLSLQNVNLNNICLSLLSNSAFLGCTQLKSVILSGSLMTIGNSAFYNCVNLEELNNISDTLCDIGISAFAYCSKLRNINLANASYLSTIEQSVFVYCSNLGEIILPERLTEISNNSFNNSGITSITFNSNLETIGDTSFYNCTKLQSVIIPSDSKIKQIGLNAFQDCINLETFNFESLNLLENVGLYAFKNCKKLTEINLEYSTLLKISDFMFQNCEKVSTLILPNSLVEVGNTSFMGCKNLTSVKIPPSVHTIGSDCFRESGLSYVEFEKWSVDVDGNGENLVFFCELTSINGSAFRDCINLKNIEIPDSVINIRSYAFMGTGITEVCLPNSVKRIGRNSFSECTSVLITTAGTWYVAADSSDTIADAIAIVETNDSTITAEQMKGEYADYYYLHESYNAS